LGTDRYRFGEFEFDAVSGELGRRDAPGEVRRLPPQPAKLLRLLLEKRGAVATREEIRERIWPDLEIEFDKSLHFCIRQIRAALGDSADLPRYVETLPRRGYRLVARVDTVPPPSESAPGTARRRRRWQIASALAILFAAVAVVLLTGHYAGGSTERPLRIGVMPFRPAATSAFPDVPPIAEWLLEELTVRSGSRAEIVGPTTTAGFDDDDRSLTELADVYRLDYIVNGRFVDDDGARRMLAELIRVSDGAHTWVKAYTELDDGRRIGREIGDHVVHELDLAARER
jgi:DNA-binding winged helix-turn-helix (wHTH) protein/TolB-like protein